MKSLSLRSFLSMHSRERLRSAYGGLAIFSRPCYSVGSQTVNRGHGERAYTSIALPVYIPPRQYGQRYGVLQ